MPEAKKVNKQAKLKKLDLISPDK